MTRSLAPLSPIPAPEPIIGGLENPFVAKCEAEWYRVYNAFIKRKKTASDAIQHADWAYRDAMPAPVGYTNICNFIACVIYAMLMGRLDLELAPKLLYGAQVALSTIAPQSKTQQKPPAASATPLPPSPPPLITNALAASSIPSPENKQVTDALPS